jgi:hypothetical protein
MGCAVIEEWRPVVGFEGLYEVSNAGQVASLHRRRIIMAQHPDWFGYMRLMLRTGGRYWNRKVHVLVAEAFIEPRPEGKVVRHLDGDPRNNLSENLAWGTSAENNQDMLRHGTHSNAFRTHCRRKHPLAGENLYVNATSGGRVCRTCQRVAQKNFYARRAMS